MGGGVLMSMMRPGRNNRANPPEETTVTATASPQPLRMAELYRREGEAADARATAASIRLADVLRGLPEATAREIRDLVDVIRLADWNSGLALASEADWRRRQADAATTEATP